MPLGRRRINIGPCIECGKKPQHCRHLCRSCYGRKWRTENHDHYQNYQRKYTQRRQNDPKRIAYNRKKSRESYLRNKEKVIARTMERYWADPRKWRDREQKWIKNNRDKKRAAYKRWYAKKRGSSGDGITAENWENIKDIWGSRCAYCANQNAELTQDHVIPLSRGGQHEIGNVVPSCKSCNSSKGNKLLGEWKPQFRYCS